MSGRDSPSGRKIQTLDDLDTATFNVGLVTATTAALILDFSANQKIIVTLEANVTAINVVDPLVGGGNYLIWIIQGGGGGFTMVGWQPKMRFAFGAPVLGDAVGTFRQVSFSHLDGINFLSDYVNPIYIPAP